MYPPSYFKMLLHLFFVFLVFPNKYNYNKYLSKYHVGHIDDFNTLYLVIQHVYIVFVSSLTYVLQRSGLLFPSFYFLILFYFLGNIVLRSTICFWFGGIFLVYSSQFLILMHHDQ